MQQPPVRSLLLLAMLITAPAVVVEGIDIFAGHSWNRMTNTEKVVYLKGATDGSEYRGDVQREAVLEAMADPKTAGKFGACTPDEIVAIIEPMGFAYVTIRQLMDGLDEVYADYRNVGIPTVAALGIVERAIKGASEQDITRRLEALRRAVSK